MMRQRNLADASLLRAARQKFVTQFPRRHFERQLVCDCKFTNIRAARYERQPQLFRHALNQAFIGIAAATAQLMIEMRDREPPIMRRRYPRQQM